MYKLDLAKICNLLIAKLSLVKNAHLPNLQDYSNQNAYSVKTLERHCQNSRYIKCAKMSLSKFAHLATTKNDALQIAYLASMRCKSMSENVLDIIQTVHLMKTQKRHCQNLRFIKCAKMALVKICTFSKYKKCI